MTDDDLERMLFALPLATTPADLHGRILAATVYRPRAVVRTWEIWAIGTIVALLVWLSFLVFSGAPDLGDRFLRGVMIAVTTLSAQFTTATALWTALGISAAVWLSQLSLPRRRPLDS